MVLNKRLVVILSLIASGASMSSAFARSKQYRTSAAPARTSMAEVTHQIPQLDSASDGFQEFIAATSIKGIISFMQQEGVYLRGKEQKDFIVKAQKMFVPRMIENMFGYLTKHNLYDTSKQNLLDIKNALDKQINNLEAINTYLGSHEQALNTAARLMKATGLMTSTAITKKITQVLGIQSAEAVVFEGLIHAIVALDSNELTNIEQAFNELVYLALKNLREIRADVEQEAAISLSVEKREKVHRDIEAIRAKLVTKSLEGYETLQTQLDKLFENHAQVFMTMFDAMPEISTSRGAWHVHHAVNKNVANASGPLRLGLVASQGLLYEGASYGDHDHHEDMDDDDDDDAGSHYSHDDE